ncbi:MAG: type II toxin-antitoxin system VapC family toxin [bacterium]|nr:type II toxin-antitoxin system VapC family toxin [bacterium]
MTWVVDTCMLIDILEDDPRFGEASAQFFDHHTSDGLVVCPVTYAELAPAFRGNLTLQDEFLDGIGVDCREDWVRQDTLKAHEAWSAHIRRRRGGQAPKRPLADILIGSFALRFQGLMTRNPDGFRTAFPSLELRVPIVPENDDLAADQDRDAPQP